MFGYQISSRPKLNLTKGGKNLRCKFYSNCWNYGGFKKLLRRERVPNTKAPIDRDKQTNKKILWLTN